MTVHDNCVSYPSILVGYMEPKEVWLSYCWNTERNVTHLVHFGNRRIACFFCFSKSPLHNISPYVSAPPLDSQDDYKTRRKSAGLCHRYLLRSPANRNKALLRLTCDLQNCPDFIESHRVKNTVIWISCKWLMGGCSPPRPAEQPAAWPWRWCLPVRGSVAPSPWGADERSAVLGGYAPVASCRAPQRCRDSAATAGYAEGGSHRSDYRATCTRTVLIHLK